MTSTNDQARLKTGIEGLDYILHGGFIRGGVYLFMGPPGSGKTVLGNQICFHQAEQNQQAIFITLLAENHAHMLQHMRNFLFYDVQKIGNQLHYHSGYSVLEKEGLSGLLTLIRRAIRDYHPSILVMDGLSSTVMLDSDLEFKRFITKIQVHAAAMNCTIFLLTHLYEKVQGRPEITIVDGILKMTNTIVQHIPIREIEIQKMRGTQHIRGEHFFDIIAEGIKIYPRLESQALAIQATNFNTDSHIRYAFSIPAFDAMLNGGIYEYSTTLLAGPTGSGKTLLGLHFLSEGIRLEEPSLYFGFSEMPNEILMKAHLVNIHLTGQTEINIIWNTTFENSLDELAEQLLTAVKTLGIKRLFIDGIHDLKSVVVHERRFSPFVKALAVHLQGMGVTTVVSYETAGLFESNVNLASVVAHLGFGENIILLRHIEHQADLYRLISIIKMRHSSFDSSVHMFTIGDRGIVVEDTSTAAKQLYLDIAKRMA